MAQPLGAHNQAPDSDDEDIPVAHAYVPGGQNNPVSQPPPAASQPYVTPQPPIAAGQPYNAPQQVYEAHPFPSYPYDASKVPPVTPNYNVGGKPVAAGAVAADPPAKCLGIPRKLFFIILALVALLAVGLAVGVGVAVAGGGSKDKGSGTNSPGQSPANPSTPVSNSPSLSDPPGSSIPIGTVKPSSPSSGTPPTSTTQAPGLPSTTTAPAATPLATVKPISQSSSPSTTPAPPLATSKPIAPVSPSITPAPKATTAPTTGSSPTPTLFAKSGTLTSDGQDMVTAINNIRRQNGLPSLLVDSTLVCVAQQLSETKGGQANPTCDSTGYPLQTRATQCRATFDSVSQLTGCEYYLATNQVNSWATDARLSGVLFDSTFTYIGADGYANERFWTAIFA